MKRVVLVVLGAYVALHGFVLFMHPVKGVFSALAQVMILPAGIVDGIPVWYPRVARLTNEYRDSDQTLSKHDAFELALNRAVYDASVTALGHELDVSFGRGDDNLARARKVAEAVLASSVMQDKPTTRLVTLRKRMIDDGMPFGDAAKRYSDDKTGVNNGDLGYISKNEAEEWLLPAFSLEAGKISDVISGPDALWILEVIETGEHEGDPWIHLRGISAKKSTLDQIISSRHKSSRPWVFVL
ncbi:MAG: peptidylprolyl isomerase [Patescibacteria group bacterium]|jgi:hypothetical protein